MASYTTIDALRDAGVTVAQASDLRLTAVIELASAMIDRYTGRTFGAVSKTIRVDGTGARALLLNECIVSIEEIHIIDSDDTISAHLDLDSVRIYNRHLTENLTDPDDRDSPRIEWGQVDRYREFDNLARYENIGQWPRGRKNIELVGQFGYTDYDGTATGRVPLLIEHACNLLVVRELAPIGDPNAAAAWSGPRVRREKTRDQEVEYESASSFGRSGLGVGRFTGDPRIDSILENFIRPPMLGSA